MIICKRPSRIEHHISLCRKIRPMALSIAVCAATAAAMIPSDSGLVAGAQGGWLTDSILRSPCSLQARLYEKMADDVTLPDTQIAAACRRRADLAFALGSYATAFTYYKRAAGFEDAPGMCCLLAASAAHARGDRASATAMRQSVADDGEGDSRNEARVALAEEAMERNDCRGALVLLEKVPLTSPDKCFVANALLDRLTCARRLGMRDSLQLFALALAPYAELMLERDRVGETVPNSDSAPPPETVKNPSLPNIGSAAAIDEERGKVEYLVRIGPFKVKKHAEALKKKLTRHAGKSHLRFTVAKKRSGYLLAITGFDSREGAEKFGKDKLKGQEIAYRIIER